MEHKDYYFDNSTTSFPKPKEVADAMQDFQIKMQKGI